MASLQQSSLEQGFGGSPEAPSNPDAPPPVIDPPETPPPVRDPDIVDPAPRPDVPPTD